MTIIIIYRYKVHPLILWWMNKCEWKVFPQKIVCHFTLICVLFFVLSIEFSKKSNWSVLWFYFDNSDTLLFLQLSRWSEKTSVCVNEVFEELEHLEKLTRCKKKVIVAFYCLLSFINPQTYHKYCSPRFVI